MIATKWSTKLVLSAAVVAALSSTASHADWDEEPLDKSVVMYKEGHIGLGAGALTGAAVGGPPGLVLGAMFGKLYGRHQGMQTGIENRDKEIDHLRAQVNERDQSIARLQQDQENKVVLASLANVPIEDQSTLEQLMPQGFAYTVHFKSGSDHIEAHLREQCRALARVAAKFPELNIHLEGYADARGDDAYNLELSHKRLQAVNDLLVQEGIAQEQINRSAKGETDLLMLGDDVDSHAFDRRVVISFSVKAVQS